MRLKRATSLKTFRRRRRKADLGDDFGARSRRRRRRPSSKKRPAKRPAPREQRRRQRAERVRERLWGEAVPLGENIRIQAAEGYRGAFMELRPGLYLVAELRTEGMEGEFGRKVKVKDVTDEIVRVTDKALDAIFPRRREQREARKEQARQRRELQRREQAQARREREARERAEQRRAARALPAPRQPVPEQRQLPAPRQQLLPQGAARWLDDDADEGLAGYQPCEEKRR